MVNLFVGSLFPGQWQPTLVSCN